MTVLTISDVKEFMRKLFRTEIFDRILLVSFEVLQETELRIDGVRNRSRISEGDPGGYYVAWGELREKVSLLIRGSKSPDRIKGVYRLAEEETKKVLGKLGISDVDVREYGLFFTLRFENGELSLLTGTSCSDFMTGKRLDLLWEDDLIRFLKYYDIGIEKQ